MTKTNPKNGDTCIRVLDTLKILIKEEASIQDIINYFEKTDIHSKTYTNEAILKYINTLKVFGFIFDKHKDKYVLQNSPKQIDLTMAEIRLIKTIENYAKIFPEESIE